MKRNTISITLSSLLLFTGCATNNAFMDNIGKIGGTTAGAGIGAVIGKQIAGDSGLVIGAMIGGSIGYLVGDEIDKRRAELTKIAQEEKVEVYSQNITNKNLGNVHNTNKEEVVGDSFTIISDDNQFELGSSTLNPKASQLFAKFAQQYKNSDKKILIIGHTDDSGDSSFNQKLSEDRAKNVGQIFNTQGIKEENIFYLGAGEINPIADNNTIEGSKKNRRVEIVELNEIKDIAIYSNRTSIPEYFKKVLPKNKIVKNTTKEDTNKLSNQKEKNTSVEKEINISQNKNIENKLTIDFEGKKVVDNTFALKKEFGSTVQENNFSFINKAYADDKTNVYVNCLYDKPRTVGKTKSLHTNKDIDHSTSEFKKGLNEVPWIANVNSHLVGINPIGVLSNGSKTTTNPKVTVYKNYEGNSNQKADLNIQSSVNTYQGSEGLIYRVFIEENKNNLECIDIVFNEKDILNSKGVIYYTKNETVYEKDFNITQIKK